MCGVNYICMSILDSTHVYTHTQCLHTSATFTHLCMLVWQLQQVSQLVIYSLSHNATFVVTLFFSYRSQAAHHKVVDELMEEVELKTPILQLAVSHLTEPLFLLEVTVIPMHHTRCSAKSHNRQMYKQNKTLSIYIQL